MLLGAIALLVVPAGGFAVGVGQLTAPYAGVVVPNHSLYTYGCRTSGSFPGPPKFDLTSGFGGFDVRTTGHACTNMFTNYVYTLVTAGWTISIDLGRAGAAWQNISAKMSFNITGNLSLLPGACKYLPGYAAYYACYAQAQVYLGGSGYIEDLTTSTWRAVNLSWGGWWRTLDRYDTCAYSKCYPVTYGRAGDFQIHKLATWWAGGPFTVGDRYAFVLGIGGWASSYIAASVARMPGASTSAELHLDPSGGGARLDYVWVQ